MFFTLDTPILISFVNFYVTRNTIIYHAMLLLLFFLNLHFLGYIYLDLCYCSIVYSVYTYIYIYVLLFSKINEVAVFFAYKCVSAEWRTRTFYFPHHIFWNRHRLFTLYVLYGKLALYFLNRICVGMYESLSWFLISL